jgi:MgtE intracellular N domain
MVVEREALRDWHRLFGLLLIDFFSGSPYAVDVERDLSEQQQFLDVAIVRRRRGRFVGRLPDGLEDLAEHNLTTFKSHREALDDWAIRELIAHYVAYRKLVSRSPSDLLAPDQFRLYAVCARFPHNLAGLVPWQDRQPGVYDLLWGLDTVRVIVAGELLREAQNAPLHLFSASPDLIGFGQATYRQRSAETSLLLGQLFERLREEGFAMSFTMEDFKRQYIKEHFSQLTPDEQREALERLSPEHRREVLQVAQLTPHEQREALERLSPEHRREVLQSLPPEERLAGLSAEQIRQYLDRLTAEHPAPARRPRRKKS